MRLTSKGQVTIPVEIRRQLALHPGTAVEFDVEGDAVRLRKASSGQQHGANLVATLRGRGDLAMSTDEIMALTRADD